jgi:gamma-glutamylcyclotransferase
VREYFAYGSNMSPAAIDAVSPGHRFLGRARLPGHRLAFTRRSVRTGTGVADIVADPPSVVWGVLYELADADLEPLDRKEGAGWAYARTDVQVFVDDGTRHDALAYVVISKSAVEIAPSAAYARGLLDAGRERGLPADYLAALVSIAPAA